MPKFTPQQLETIARKMKEMGILDRFFSPSPEFFIKLRNLGLLVTTISAILSISGNPVISDIATYCASAGVALSIVSQLPVDETKVGEKMKEMGEIEDEPVG